METVPLATSLTFVTEAELACQTGNLKASRVILASRQDHAWPTNALLMENALRTLLLRMVQLVALKATNALWQIHVPWESVSREPSLNQAAAVAVPTVPHVTRRIPVMEREPAFLILNPKASPATLVLS